MIPRYTRPAMGAVWKEENKFSLWLKIEILACEAMQRHGQIPAAELRRIKRRGRFSIPRIQAIEKEVGHDVIAFLTNVAENVGPAARHLHKGLTSSDVVDTALAVQLVQSADLLIGELQTLCKAVAAKARRYKYTAMVGRTHGVHAEPTTFGLKMALMYDEFGRALQHLEAARKIVRVGHLAGAVGTYAHADPSVEKYVCTKLKLEPAAISTQILPRDRHAAFLNGLALVGCSIERWAQEFRHLQRTEVREVEEFFGSTQKGSSAMPHKKNPVIAERLCGMARLLRGYALVGMENVPLWHERDISHSSAERVILPDATIVLDYMLSQMTFLVKTMTVLPANMKKNLAWTGGLIHSQQVLLLLTRKGLSRERAYRIVQRHAIRSWNTGAPLLDLLKRDRSIAAIVSARELERAFDLAPHFKHVDRIFRRVGLR